MSLSLLPPPCLFLLSPHPPPDGDREISLPYLLPLPLQSRDASSPPPSMAETRELSADFLPSCCSSPNHGPAPPGFFLFRKGIWTEEPFGRDSLFFPKTGPEVMKTFLFWRFSPLLVWMLEAVRDQQ